MIVSHPRHTSFSRWPFALRQVVGKYIGELSKLHVALLIATLILGAKISLWQTGRLKIAVAKRIWSGLSFLAN